ncbi:alpha-(1-_3)-arabinofuranosyltransferase family protein [Streptomyces sp. NPDC051776]|uniref:alpha-(1->3)-arabinofuranosyltransferase domain-containing protein n=1 Tax=Streptomyces sp. NPDC051776 TaxID=3155414 RepID=UPI003415B6F7
MSSTVQVPPQAPAPSAVPPPAPERPCGRGWLAAFWVLALIAFGSVSPGKTTFETKLGVALEPLRFIGDLGELWHDRAGFGVIADQYIGYAFPSLPYYALMDLVHVPVWVAERLWLSLVVTAAFWGSLRLAERFRVGAPGTRLLGAAAYALWPTFTIVIGSTSAAALPGAMLPWVLLPLTRADLAPRIAAARSALLVPFMGGVNAASTLASLLPVGLYLLSRPGGPRKRALLAWWLPGVVLATLWWVVPLLLLGTYGENFMPYVEQADTTTATMSATELLRGAGNWVAYLHFGEAWLPAGWSVATSLVVILGSVCAAALGLAGLARRDLPERRWLVLTVLAVVLISLAGYGGSFGAPFHGTVREWLNGPLGPFRNIYKFQPGLALALALGLAHLTAVAAERRGARPVPGRRLATAIAALLVLPGLAWPYANGSILQPGPFTGLPSYWSSAAGWLKTHASGSRALVVPATAHGIYTWGSPIDQPLDVLAESRWAQRDYVPFGTAGSRRALDAVEQALTSGGRVPGLSAFLGRAGLYEVVVRNDLDPDQIGYVPPQTVKRTLESSGYRKVAGFGPLITAGRIPDDTPVQVQGLFPRLQAVEIYRPERGTHRPERAALRPAATTAVVSGGPEALLRLAADPAMRERPAVLAGDGHPGLGTPPVRAVADGLRRADTRFGLVNSNTSYTYTESERNHPDSLQDPGREPRQILPTRGSGHQTTAVLRGARSVTASSSGNWLFHLPQYDPVNAFDGNPDTAWAEGSPGRTAGQWLRIGFSSPVEVPASIELAPLPGNGMRAAPTQIRVETDRGRADSPLQPSGARQSVKAPAGKATWLRIRILDAQEARPGLSGAGFSEVSVPGVQVTRLLALPRDAEGEGGGAAGSTVYSLHRGSDPGGLAPATAEVGLHRQFRTGSGGEYRIRARALPVPGDALDRLLDRVAPGSRDRVTATADSTSRSGLSLSPRNLVDRDLTTAWIAGDRPVIHLRWPGKKKISEIVFAAAGGVSAQPQEVLISSPDGAATAGVDRNGQARFDHIRTDRLDITISRTAPLTLHNPLADGQLQLPVGLSEVYVPALDDLRVPAPDPDATFSVPCGDGPPLAMDGTLHATKASGSVRDLTERRPIEVELCAGPAKDGSLDLGAGRHVVEAGDAGPLALTDVTLSTGETPAVIGDARSLTVRDWGGDHRTVTVGAGRASYLQTYENANDGWKATLDGKELTPLRLDGWQQAWLVPEGEGGTVRLEYEPAKLYRAGLIGGAAGVVLLAGLAFVRRRRTTDGSVAAAGAHRAGGTSALLPPGPGLFLGTVVLTAVLAAVAGPLALVVPVLAVVARLRPGLLVPTALVAMAGAGVAAAAGAGEPVASGEGAFGAPAQVLAVVALAAALVTADRPDAARARGTSGDGPGDPAVDHGTAAPGDGVPRGGSGAGADHEPSTARRPQVPGDEPSTARRPRAGAGAGAGAGADDDNPSALYRSSRPRGATPKHPAGPVLMARGPGGTPPDPRSSREPGPSGLRFRIRPAGEDPPSAPSDRRSAPRRGLPAPLPRRALPPGGPDGHTPLPRRQPGTSGPGGPGSGVARPDAEGRGNGAGGSA